MEWHEQQSECYPTQLMLLKRVRELVQRKQEGVQCVRFHILHRSHSVLLAPPLSPFDCENPAVLERPHYPLLNLFAWQDRQLLQSNYQFHQALAMIVPMF
ncbi:hypothetical protein TNCV_2139471 [Trichonephila clavipes]|uniref:Uncharacterized protein n=1 Tax=Trichonephila clavipes TaxID=2585209 RepID=A0A8X6RXE9_TRICX|nr:hypothetical protein TNCV_2139471 [Trichonephila clavipes]